ncbi:hypothetical protein KDH_24340 [Dictyobacter sp. S3.2.2.5]|uniref:YggT family protein n=1 Tax=Dictyobacter halimunensis TaxID=3026934 RepID=A0ABQ6FPJ5_9CHLR|nr:hypothetical protein KDH_24340 [Dictyobacter sp. S3.2.2.5]
MPNQPYSYNNDPRNDPRQNYPNQQGSYQDYDADTEQNINAGGAYVRNQQQTYQDQAGNQVQQRREVYRDFNQSMINTRYWITSLIYFLLGVLEVVLGLRFLFRLFGASEGSPFIRFLYDLSHPFVYIFNGIFNDQTIGSTGVFEVSTILAMLIYALIAWGIVSLVRVIFFANVPSRREYISTRRQGRL